MLDVVVPFLACPRCGGPVRLAGPVLGCAGGHAFDLARQGYVTLLPPGGSPPAGDSAAMLAARDRFLAAGHYAALAARVAAAAGSAAAPGCLVEVGAGTGHYLAAALDAAPDRVGIGLDASKYAGRRLARAHPRAGAVVADVWRRLPIRDGAAAAVLDVFAPRNGPELGRILAPGGVLVVVTPTAAHLTELVGALGLITVDERKAERLAGTLHPYVEPVSAAEHSWSMELTAADVRALIGMGPSAHHLTPDLDARLARLTGSGGRAGRGGPGEPVRVTASVRLSVYRRGG
ncbi:MAG: rRNA (guanine745-N1)-methyltransferase [Mycobacteriales bacterium]